MYESPSLYSPLPRSRWPGLLCPGRLNGSASDESLNTPVGRFHDEERPCMLPSASPDTISLILSPVNDPRPPAIFVHAV